MCQTKRACYAYMSSTSTPNMYISILAMGSVLGCRFQQTMSTFITTPSLIHNQDFVFKKTVFANNAIFSKIMFQSKDLFWLIQAPNIFKHISRNGGATIKASRKTAHDKVILILGQKGHFSPQNGGTMKNVIALNLYIVTNVLVYERRLMMKVFSMTKFLC